MPHYSPTGSGLHIRKPKNVAEPSTISQEEIKNQWRECMESIVKAENLPYFKGQEYTAKRLYAEKRRLESLLHED